VLARTNFMACMTAAACGVQPPARGFQTHTLTCCACPCHTFDLTGMLPRRRWRQRTSSCSSWSWQPPGPPRWRRPSAQQQPTCSSGWQRQRWVRQAGAGTCSWYRLHYRILSFQHTCHPVCLPSTPLYPYTQQTHHCQHTHQHAQQHSAPVRTQQTAAGLVPVNVSLLVRSVLLLMTSAC
jgi:hypothetical protein